MKNETLSRGKKALFVIGVVGMALAAGVAGAALVANYAVSSLTFSTVTSNVSTRPATKVDVTKVGTATRSSVVFYKKHTGSSVLDKVFLPSDAVGAGVVLTADGWLMSSSSVFASHDQLVAVFSDRTAVNVNTEKAIHDEATGLAYIKVEAQHLAVAVFGDDTTLQSADPVFSISADNVVASNVVAPRRLPVATRADYIESSEYLGRRILIDKSGLVGSLVVDANGVMMGIDEGNKNVVPVTFVSDVLRDLFKDGKVARPQIGVRYISLDNLPILKNSGLPTTGALVTGDGKVRSVEKGSVAEKAGLRESDVITMIERDRINNEATLSERLQDYVPGAKVELTVVRDGATLKLPLTLK